MARHPAAYLGSLLLLTIVAAVNSTITLSVLPDALWVSNGGVHNVAEGHVIQVYCSATNTTVPTIRWEKGGTEIFQDPPHIFIRTSVSGTTRSSVLTIDQFNSTDDGVYRCIATADSTSASSGLLTLTTISSLDNTSLTISRQPADNEQNPVNTLTNVDLIANSRTGVRVTDVDPAGTSDANRLMTCIASHVGGASAVSTPPTLVWTRNGEAVVADGTHIITDTQQGDQLQSNLQINSFADSDAGIYQCIYTDTDSDAEVATSLPHRLDYGDVLRLSSITPQLIIIEPPERLVIEVQSSGAYDVINWARNGALYTFNDPDFPISSDRFFYFYEAYVRDPTSMDDLGLYEVSLLAASGQDTPLAPDQFFTVVRYVPPTTTTTQSPTETVMEGGSLTLTCTSEGTPTPTFTWRLNGQDIPTDRHTETPTAPVVEFNRGTGRVTSVTNGMTTSLLTISGAVFPGDDGLYECIGTNSRAGMDNSSSAFIQLSVQVEPEVEVSATPQARIALGQSVSLFCNVTRANPNVNFTYVWRRVLVSTLPEETNTLVLSSITADQFGNYQCEVTNDAGSGSATIRIEQGFLPSVSVDEPAPVVIGTSVVMNCSASGDMPISYMWEQVVQGGVVLSTDESFTLMVTNASQYGMYRCTATNILGSDSGTVDVVQASVPMTTGGRSVDVTVGDPLVLTVNITDFNLPLTEVTWEGVGGVTLNDTTPRVTIVTTDLQADPASSTLTLDMVVSLIDQGQYRATAINPAGNTATTFDVTVLAPAIITSPATPQSVTVDEGDSVTLACEASGSPAPTFSWLNSTNGLVLDSSTAATITNSSEQRADFFYTMSNLTISPAREEDAGTYRCVAQTTVGGQAQQDYTLVVNFVPRISVPPENVQAEYLDTVTVNCTAEGMQPPSFAWYREVPGQPPEQLNDTLFTTEPGVVAYEVVSVLTLSSVEPIDTANYTCEATNDLGSDNDTAEVTVLAAAEILMPTMPQNVSVNTSNSVNLTCQARGSPVPIFMWYFNGNPASQTPTTEQTGSAPDFITVTSTLEISNAQRPDAGTYTCNATNTVYGTVRYDTEDHELTVNFGVSIVADPNDTMVVSPDPIVLSCSTLGVPTPSFTWIRNSSSGTETELLPEADRVTVGVESERENSISTLTISNTVPIDSGNYFCRAVNIFGDPVDSAEATVTVYAPPMIQSPADGSIFYFNATDSATVECTATGLPAPTISFFRGGLLSTGDESGRINISDPSSPVTTPTGAERVSRILTIFDTVDGDSGQYKCEATVTIPGLSLELSNNSNFDIVIQIIPDITVSPVDVTVISPLSTNFSCEANGVPTPTITWYKSVRDSPRMPVLQDGDTIITPEDVGDRTQRSVLQVNVAQPSDDALYTCVAWNDAGSDEASAQLTVLVNPYFLEPQPNQLFTYNETDNVIFTCTAVGIPAPDILFLRNALRLNGSGAEPPNPRVILENATSPVRNNASGEFLLEVSRTLIITDTEDGDSGNYSCQTVSNPRLEVRTVTFELLVQVGPEILEPPGNLTVVFPEDAVFTCRATALPRPTITWWAGGIQLTGGSKFNISTEPLAGDREVSSNLTVLGAAPNDATVYTCLAENIVDSAEEDAELFVHVVPMILEPVVNTTLIVNQDSPVVFTCSAAGAPAPEISWYRNGSVLESTNNSRVTLGAPSSPESYNFTVDGEDLGMIYRVTRSLTLDDTEDADSGLYSCVADNGNAREPDVSREFELVVQLAPVILAPPEDITVVEGDTAVFTCLATARPRPSINWYRVDSVNQTTSLNSSGNINITTVDVGERGVMSTLTLSDAQPNIATDYVCEVISDIAEFGPVSASAQLTVHVVPEITFPNDSTIYRVNQSFPVTFECSATGIPAPYINWLLNGVRLENLPAYNSRISLSDRSEPLEVETENGTIYSVERTLILFNTTDEDSGNYTCVAFNNNVRTPNVTQDFELFVRVPPAITGAPENTTVVSPEDATFTCVATARPRPSITWWRVDGNMTRIMDDGVAYDIDEEVEGERVQTSTLVVIETEPSDALTYICVAENMAGTAQAMAQLTVHVVPEITFPNDGTIYRVNQSFPVTFECSATGIPAPYINWLLNGVRLEDLPAYNSRISLSDRSEPLEVETENGTIYSVERTLILSNTMDEDSGNYTCVAFNNNARTPNVTQDFELFVRVPPAITGAPENTTVVSPQDATFTCVATARPRPSITWWRVEEDGNMTRIMDDRVAYSIDEEVEGERVRTSTLVVMETEPSDALTYICAAENMAGTAQAVAQLTVHVIPEITVPSPNTTFNVNETFSTVIPCSATGIPAPDIQWFRSAMELTGVVSVLNNSQATNDRVVLSEPITFRLATPNGAIYQTDRTLTLYNAMGNDTGDYYCTASNGNTVQPTDRQDFDIFVQIPPDVIPLADLADGREVVGNQSGSAILPFRIDRADPPVLAADLRWFYSPTGDVTDPIQAMGSVMEITDLTNRTSVSTLNYSSFQNNEISLTVSNIVQAVDTQQSETDGGRYFLVASNPAGRNVDYIDLVVFGPPSILLPPEDAVIIDGNSVTFQCEVFAFPEHQTSWTFTDSEGVTVEIISTDSNDTEKYSIERDRGDRGAFGQLTVMNVQYGDRGTYSCTAENPQGSRTANATLTVHVTPRVANISDLTEVNVTLSATLACLTTGYPLPFITWQKDGVGLEQSIDARVTYFSFDIIPEMGGNMSVYESSGYEGSGSISGLVQMAGFSMEEVESLGELGVVGVLVFEMVEREDTAMYTCTATNSLPETTELEAVSQPVQLVVLEVPDPPVNVTVVLFGSRWVVISWEAPFDGNRPITQYIIYQSTESGNFTEVNRTTVMESSGMMIVPMTDLSFNISTGIFPYTNYSFTVQACNVMGCGDLGEPSPEIRTEQDTPEAAPEDLTAVPLSFMSVFLSWSPPPEEFHNGIIMEYRIQYTPSGSSLPVRTAFSTDTMATLTGLVCFTEYNIEVSARTAAPDFGPSAPTTIRTLNFTSSPPRNLVATNVQTTNVYLNWTEPDMPCGIISHYTVYYTGTKTTDVAGFEPVSGNLDTSGPETEIVITDLIPDTVYIFSIAAVNGAGEGARSAQLQTTTLVGPPPVIEPPITGVPPIGGPRTYTLGITRPSNINGPISHYHVVVVLLRTGTTPDENGLSVNPDTDYPTLNSLTQFSYTDTADCILPLLTEQEAYIAAEFGDDDFPDNVRYIVGDPTQPNDNDQYENGPLCYGATYTFFLRAYVQGSVSRKRQTNLADRVYTDFSSSAYSEAVTTDPEPDDGGGGDSSIGIAIGVVVVVIIVIALIVVVVLIVLVVVKRRRKYVYKTTAELGDQPDHDSTFIASQDSMKLVDYKPPEEGEVTRQPIPVAALSAHLEQMHVNENCGFGEEYRLIQENSPKLSVENCIAPDNKPRNRYANIQCFDQSRVLLRPVEGFEHDYINANYIDGYNRVSEYIATQGPLPDTVGDFWRLVWDHNAATIVMLTNLVEKMKVKCTQYWPNQGSQQYSNITVTIKDTVVHADFIIRHFQIKAADSEETKELRQFHFISWPDFGVPRHSTPLLYFMRRVRAAHPTSCTQPIVVHCSAGVGRSGTLMGIDIELQRARQEGIVDPFNLVLVMRRQRNHMVQTEAQYVFLHDAIMEGITSGNTEVPVDRLGQRMTELEQTDSDGETGFQKEFNRLRQFRVNIREFTDANDDANKFKNRLANALPFNYNRVHLQMSPGVGGSDYINASFVDGYSQKASYIATQGPLPNTIEDFWRMVWEKDVHVVVMLTQLKEKDKDQCARYWPEALHVTEKQGSYTLELLSENTFEDYVVRELKLTDVTATTSSSRIVRQFHFMAWPEHGAPSSGAGMIDLIDQVTRAQQQTGNKSIVVHCSAGIGRTGAFCAMSFAIERVKAEGMVDIFHTVKHLRTQRPHMVQTVEQFMFLYRAIREYVESLSTYSNFQ